MRTKVNYMKIALRLALACGQVNFSPLVTECYETIKKLEITAASFMK